MNLAQLLEDDEGRRKTVYQDHLGYWTIGVGVLVDDRKPGAGLRDNEIDFILMNRIAEVTAEVTRALPWFSQLNEPRQAVLLSMAFQMGTPGLLAFKNALAAVKRQDWTEAKRQMLDSTWAKQTPARAERMAKQMEIGEWVTF
jgi:lysozyme